MMKITYEENFLTDEVAQKLSESKPSTEIAGLIAEAIEDYDIEVTDSPNPEENEGFLFGAWIMHNIHKFPDENEEDVFDSALAAFAEEHGEDPPPPDTTNQNNTQVSPPPPPENEIEIKTSAETKLKFETDPVFRDSYTKAAKLLCFRTYSMTHDEIMSKGASSATLRKRIKKLSTELQEKEKVKAARGDADARNQIEVEEIQPLRFQISDLKELLVKNDSIACLISG